MKRTFSYMVFLVSILAGGTVPRTVLPAEQVTVRVETTNPFPVIGDSLSFIVTVSLPAGVSARTPVLPVESSAIDIVPQWEHTDSTGMGATRKQFGLLAYVFKADTLVVGPFMTEYVSADGATGTAFTDSLTLRVRGVLQADNTAPMPDRAPIEIPVGFPWKIVAAALAAFGVILFLVARRKRPQQDVIPDTPEDDIEVFRRIAAMRLNETGEIRRLYILLSDAAREFIYRRVGFDARPRTTWEIRRKLTNHRLHRNSLPAILDILDEADMVKFARYDPPVEDSKTVADRAVAAVQRIMTEINRERDRIAAMARESANRETEHETPVGAQAGGGG